MAEDEYGLARWEALLLFCSIAERLGGNDEAARVFHEVANHGDEWLNHGLLPRSEFQNRLLLDIYDTMSPDDRSVPALWRLVSDLNRKFPKHKIGPRGPQSLAAFERHMTRLLKGRKG